MDKEITNVFAHLNLNDSYEDRHHEEEHKHVGLLEAAHETADIIGLKNRKGDDLVIKEEVSEKFDKTTK